MHVVAEVWCEPHVVGSRARGAEGIDKVVIWQSFAAGVCGDHVASTSGRVAPYARVEEERVGEVGVVSHAALEAWRRHVLHVGSPSQPRALDSIDDAGVGCGAGPYGATVRPAEVVVPAREAHVVGKAGMVARTILCS